MGLCNSLSDYPSVTEVRFREVRIWQFNSLKIPNFKDFSLLNITACLLSSQNGRVQLVLDMVSHLGFSEGICNPALSPPLLCKALTSFPREYLLFYIVRVSATKFFEEEKLFLNFWSFLMNKGIISPFFLLVNFLFFEGFENLP